MNACGGGRKRGDGGKDDQSKLPKRGVPFDQNCPCPHCHKKIPNTVWRMTDICPFCTRRTRPFQRFRTGDDWPIKDPNECLLSRSKNSTGIYKKTPVFRGKEKQAREIPVQSSCSMAAALHRQQQLQQNMLTPRQLMLDRQRDRLRRIDEQQEQLRQQLENERIRQREAALLQEDDQASVGIQTLDVQSQDSVDDKDGPK